jgi:hypothetical protein
MVLCAGFIVYPLQAQISVRDLQALEGPWECRNPIGVAGVFITAHTFLTQKSGQQDFTSQSIDINVRENKSMVDTFLRVQVSMDRQFSMVSG